ncbi:MAG: TonB-dependent receptor [Candidatus Omnitrophota bacterium]
MPKLLKKLLLPAVLCLVSLVCYSQDPVDLGNLVITPSKTEVESKYHDIHVNVLGQENIEGKNLFTAGETLSGITGVDVIGGGRLGSSSEGIYIRGARTRHTAYLFEGLKIYDPSNTSAYYVPSDFLATGLNKIEIVKFPLSSLYGSSPIGGAVNFLVKRPAGRPHINISSLSGSHDTFQESLELGGESNNLSYLFNIARVDSKGISKAKEKNNNPERDPYQNTNLTLGLNYQEPQNLEMALYMRGSHSRTEIDDDDNLDGFPEDDPDNLNIGNEFFGTTYIKKNLLDCLDYKIQAGYTRIYRKVFDDNEGGADEYTRGWYKGSTYQLSNHFELRPLNEYRTLVGFDYTQEHMDSYRYTYDYAWAFGYASDSPKVSSYAKGWFVEQIINPWENLNVDFSYRREYSPLFKYHSVVKSGVSYSPIDNSNLFFSYGEGFKAPSLYQLFSSNGNRNLEPEESKTWEAGFKQAFGDKISLNFAYFHSNLKGLIDFVFTNPSLYQGEYKNAAKQKMRGVEISFDYKPDEALKIETGYTHLNGEQDFVDDNLVDIFSRALIRVPRHKAYFNITWEFKKLKTILDFIYAGSRTDRIWVGAVDSFVPMKPYTLVNLNCNYRLNDKSTLFIKVNNLLNKDYERIKGYQEEKLSLYTGFKCEF